MIYTLDLFRYTIYITFYKAYVAVLQKKTQTKLVIFVKVLLMTDG